MKVDQYLCYFQLILADIVYNNKNTNSLRKDKEFLKIMSQYNFYNMRYKKTNSVDIKNFGHTVSKFKDNFNRKDEIRKEFKEYNDDFNNDYKKLKNIQKAKQEKLPQTKEEFHDLRNLYKAIDYKIPNMKKNLFENSSLLIKNNMLKTYFMFKKQDNTLVNELDFLDRIHNEAFDRIYNSDNIVEENTRKKTNLNQYKKTESLDIDNIALEIRRNEKEMAKIKDNMKDIHLESDRNLNIIGNKSTKSILHKSTRSIGSTTFMSKNSNDASTLNTIINNKINKKESKKIIPIINPINKKKNIKLALFKADTEQAEEISSRKKTSDFNFFRKGLGLTVAEKHKNNNFQSNSVNSIDFDKRNSELETLYEKFSKKEGESMRADSIYKYLLEYTDKKNLTSQSFSPGDIVRNINEIKTKISNLDVKQTFSGFNEKSIVVNPRLLENITTLDKTINKYEYDLIKYLNCRK